MMSPPKLRIIGRPSSHYTRVARIFALELGVAHELVHVEQLMSTDLAVYGHNPALKIPILEGAGETLFGTLNVCRQLETYGDGTTALTWPEDSKLRVYRNAMELVQDSMSNQVTLIMARRGGVPPDNLYLDKLRSSLDQSLLWLDRFAAEHLGRVSPRSLSYLETCLFSLIEHLEFTRAKRTAAYPSLLGFRQRFRSIYGSAAQTEFFSDFVPR